MEDIGKAISVEVEVSFCVWAPLVSTGQRDLFCEQERSPLQNEPY